MRAMRVACMATVTALALVAMAHADSERSAAPTNDKATWFAGTWSGKRSGMPVLWRFQSDGRMQLEERGAQWSIHNDTLVVDFEPLGESGMTERAVYLYLTSNPQHGPRRIFVRGFDLGLHGLLLTREPETPDAGGTTVPAAGPPATSSRSTHDANRK